MPNIREGFRIGQRREVAQILKAIALIALLVVAQSTTQGRAQTNATAHPLLSAPIWVYNNWSAYDELSDEVPLTEALAMRELSEIERLRKAGVHFDYYMMDAFWYDPDKGYRAWRSHDWPHGPDRWISECEAAGIKPGLWFSTNTLTNMTPVPQWRSSLNSRITAMSLYSGGFLADFMDVLDYWYGRGIRMFKLDFADFTAAAEGDENRLSPQEIRLRNAQALHRALRFFRQKHPDVVLVAFNGIVGEVDSPASPLNPFNLSWLDVFDTLFSGDPRPSDLPEMDLWRAIDEYSDEMVRHFVQSSVPIERVDSTAFMIGNTGTNYFRKTNAWRGSLLLTVARGGWINTVHGNLEFLDDDDARWFARVQKLYAPLQKDRTTKWFGGNPGDVRPYGFGSKGTAGALYTAVNPSQGVRTIRLPRLAPDQKANIDGRVLFEDAGFVPRLDGDILQLGPGQLALVGYGGYANAAYDLGIESDIRIPRSIEPMRARFRDVESPGPSVASPDESSSATAANNPAPMAVETVIKPPSTGDIRIILLQRDADGSPVRSVGDSKMGRLFTITASQGGKELPVEIRYDTIIWSGLSWAVGEVKHDQMTPGSPIRVRLTASEGDPTLHLEGRIYRVEY